MMKKPPKSTGIGQWPLTFELAKPLATCYRNSNRMANVCCILGNEQRLGGGGKVGNGCRENGRERAPPTDAKFYGRLTQENGKKSRPGMDEAKGRDSLPIFGNSCTFSTITLPGISFSLISWYHSMALELLLEWYKNHA